MFIYFHCFAQFFSSIFSIVLFWHLVARFVLLFFFFSFFLISIIVDFIQHYLNVWWQFGLCDKKLMKSTTRQLKKKKKKRNGNRGKKIEDGYDILKNHWKSWKTFPSSWKVNSHVKPAILKFYHIEIPNVNIECECLRFKSFYYWVIV